MFSCTSRYIRLGIRGPANVRAKNTGVRPDEYGRIPQCPANQCATLTGGNTALNPEKANTYTVGALLTPRFIPGFTASIDYWHIKLADIITNIPLTSHPIIVIVENLNIIKCLIMPIPIIILAIILSCPTVI